MSDYEGLDDLQDEFGDEEDREEALVISSVARGHLDVLVDDEVLDSEEELIQKVKASSNEADTASLLQTKLICEKIEDEMVSLEEKDLRVIVDRPEKVIRTVESYVLFHVSTQTTRTDFSLPTYEVKRRYSDFLWLRQALTERYPLRIIPPMPEKHSLALDRFDVKFIRFRQTFLHRFLRRLCDHPILSLDPDLVAFLTLENLEFQQHRKLSRSGTSRVVSTLRALTGSHRVTERNAYHDEAYRYLTGLSERLHHLQNSTTRINSEQLEYGKQLEQMSKLYQSWSHVESAQDSDSKLSCSLSSLSQTLATLHNQLHTLIVETDLECYLPLNEYILFTDSIKEALTHQEYLQHEAEVSNTDLQRAITEYEISKQNGGSVFQVTLANGEKTSLGATLFGKETEAKKEAREQQARSHIEQLKTVREDFSDKLAVSNSEFEADYERWHVTKKRDMKELWSSLADRHLLMYDKNIESLEQLLRSLKPE